MIGSGNGREAQDSSDGSGGRDAPEDPETPDASDAFDQFSKRSALVEALAEEPLSQTDLVARSDASQSTVSRSLSTFEAMDVVDRSGDGVYELTQLGRLLLEKYRTFVAETDELLRTSEVVTALPPTVDLDPAVLDGATVTRSKPHAPDAAILPLIDVKPEATSLRSCTPVVWTAKVRTVTEQIEADDLSAEIVMTEDVARALSSLYANHESAYGTGRLRLYTTPNDLPFGLSLTETPEETYAAITVRLEADVWGTLVNTNEAAVRWVEARFDEFLERAVPWTPPGFDALGGSP